MGLFRRRSAATSASSTRPSADEAVPTPQEQEDLNGTPGPWDSAQVPAAEQSAPRLDCGALLIPARDNARLLFQTRATSADGRERSVMGVGVALKGSTLQLNVYAAPRSTGIWADMLVDIRTQFTSNSVPVSTIDGPYGPELHARLPQQRADGTSVTIPLRIMGVDGPRWCLQAIIEGPAAQDDTAAAELLDVLSHIVVVRDQHARPPREPLPLRMPNITGTAAEGQPAARTASTGPATTELR